MILSHILSKAKNNKKQLAVLIDPDKQSISKLNDFVKLIDKTSVDLIFVGGSLVNNNIDKTISEIKNKTNIPIIIFPGSLNQISKNADAILFLSLISGRNPEFLIGNHVLAAKTIKEANIEVISTGYILVENGATTSVEYMSNTKPIPATKTDIAVSTAIAGELLGSKVIYMDSGSGAKHVISEEMISEVKLNINIPLIIGGGINTTEKLKSVYTSGADIAVVGTAFENDKKLLTEFCKVKDKF